MYERIVCLLIPSENTAGDKSLTEGAFVEASVGVLGALNAEWGEGGWGFG